MPGILFDFREIEQWAAKLGVAADQIPFATARAINDSIFATRKVLVDEMWPSVVNVANPHYPSAVLRVDTATKYHLTASIHEIKETSTPLILHAKGGTKTKRKGRHFTIPTKEYKQAHRTQRGLAKRATAHELIA